MIIKRRSTVAAERGSGVRKWRSVAMKRAVVDVENGLVGVGWGQYGDRVARGYIVA